MLARNEALKRNVSVSIARDGAGWEQGWTVATVATAEQLSRRNASAQAVTVSGAPGVDPLRSERTRLAAARDGADHDRRRHELSLRRARSFRTRPRAGRGVHMKPRLSPPRRRRAAQTGALLIEVLVAVLICAFGLLGFAGMQARAVSTDFESLQRSEALVLIEDMVSRMNANRANAADYVSAGLLGEGAIVDCAGMTGAELDVCEWSNMIRGNAEQRGGSNVGAMLSARGCITRPATSSDRYVISIAWQGIVATAGSASPCGLGDDAFPNEALRRTASSTVCVALLRDAASAPVISRC